MLSPAHILTTYFHIILDFSLAVCLSVCLSISLSVFVSVSFALSPAERFGRASCRGQDARYQIQWFDLRAVGMCRTSSGKLMCKISATHGLCVQNIAKCKSTSALNAYADYNMNRTRALMRCMLVGLCCVLELRCKCAYGTHACLSLGARDCGESCDATTFNSMIDICGSQRERFTTTHRDLWQSIPTMVCCPLCYTDLLTLEDLLLHDCSGHVPERRTAMGLLPGPDPGHVEPEATPDHKHSM